ncbi:MAG: SipW-dependent-type signal peptide-containing protein [Limosilactobacillus sp.]
MKKRILVVAVLAICVAIAATGTLAYFTATGTARNVITSGAISIAIEEKTQSGNALVDFPADGLSGVMPGTSASKIVKIKNTGSSEAWIRVKVESSITGADGEDLPQKLQSGKAVMDFTILSGWTKGADGYYYYNKPVAAGASTTELLKEVTFAPEMGNEYQGCTAQLLISAQAVQTANNGATVTEAKGWPES